MRMVEPCLSATAAAAQAPAGLLPRKACAAAFTWPGTFVGGVKSPPLPMRMWVLRSGLAEH